jgi:hypothetical protein
MVKVKEQMHVATNEETKRWPQNNFIVLHLGLKGLFFVFYRAYEMVSKDN